MVINPTIALPAGYIVINMENLPWRFHTYTTSVRYYFTVNSEELGYDVESIDPTSIKCGKFSYVGALADSELTGDMDNELSIFKNLAGIRVFYRRTTDVDEFKNDLGENCYMIFKLL